MWWLLQMMSQTLAACMSQMRKLLWQLKWEKVQMRKMKQKTVSQTTTNILLPVTIASHQMINTMLSEGGPSFNLDNAPGSVSTTVAVTPFKDGKGPPLNGLLVSLPLLSDNVTNTAAVTPMHRFPPPLAPLPLVRFMSPQYIVPLHQPGMPIVPVFVPPYHF